MKYVVLLLVVAFLAGCGDGKIHWCDEEVSGMCIRYSEEFYPPGDIEKSVEIMQDVLSKHIDDLPHLPTLFRQNNVRVYFHSEMLFKNCESVQGDVYRCEHGLAGVNIDGRINYVLDWSACLAKTSLIHELMHAVLVLHLGKHEHPQPYFCELYPLCKSPGLLEKIEALAWEQAESCRY